MHFKPRRANGLRHFSDHLELIFVAVVMEKGWEQIVAVLAIHFAKAAYVPIDPQWPEGRRLQVMQQTQVGAILTTSTTIARSKLPSSVECLAVDEGDVGDVHKAPGFPSLHQSPETLAYIIFTSGSSGKPKGVAVPHRAAVNTVTAINAKYGIKQNDRVLGLSSLSFDLSVYDIFGVLAAGGAIVLPNPGQQKDPKSWWELVVKHQVTLWNSVPAFMQMAVDYLQEYAITMPPSLNKVMMSGDWIPLSLPGRLRSLSDELQVISLAGPTETAIWSITYPIESVDPKWDSIPYGKPLANQTVHVLREDLSPCPDWVRGEIVIGGRSVGLGYYQDPVKTKSIVW